MGIIVSVLVILIIIIIVYRMVSGKGIPDNSYTPFDHITGHTDTEFREEEKDVEKQEDD